MPRSKSVPKKGLYENGNQRATTESSPSPSIIPPVSLSSALRSIRPLPTPPVTRSTRSSMSPDTISEFPEELQGTYSCQVVQPGKEGTKIIPTRKEEEPEIDVVGMTDEEKSMEYTEPSQTQEWYETVELLHGPPPHNLPTDEIEKEEINLTKDEGKEKTTK